MYKSVSHQLRQCDEALTSVNCIRLSQNPYQQFAARELASDSANTQVLS